MKNAQEGTPERMLWERVDEMVAMKIEASSVGIIVKLFYDKIKPLKSVAALDRKICSMMKSWACMVLGNHEAENIHIASDTFAENILVFVVSKSSDPRLIEWINYYYQKVFESVWFKVIFERAPLKMKYSEDISIVSVALCLERNADGSESPNPINSEFLSFLFYVIGLNALISSLTLLIEIIVKKIDEVKVIVV